MARQARQTASERSDTWFVAEIPEGCLHLLPPGGYKFKSSHPGFLDRLPECRFLRWMKFLSILMVGVAVLLVGGCGEKEVLENKPAKETNREVSPFETEERDEVRYVKGETQPFTGTVIWDDFDGLMWKEQPYVDGKGHGTWIETHLNGSRKSETPYVNGEIHGAQIGYCEDGSKKSETVWANGKLMSANVWKPDGQKCPETNLKNGAGKIVSYYKDGSKERKNPYVDGKLHGTQIFYREDGSKRYETSYVNGLKHGTQIWCREDGSKRLERVYENGKKISEKEF